MSTLYIVSTPIGNRTDITLRALETLWSVDIILCEDTRETGGLLNNYKSHFDTPYPKLLSYTEHNENIRIPGILNNLQSGLNYALVTDRGTPVISDPGYKLVREVVGLGKTNPNIKVDVIPGANAILPALILSGFPPDKFIFLGFLPKQKLKQIESLINLPKITTVFYDSPKRLLTTLSVVQEALGDIEVAICLEMTKMFQKVWIDKASILFAKINETELKGEITVVLNLSVE